MLKKVKLTHLVVIALVAGLLTGLAVNNHEKDLEIEALQAELDQTQEELFITGDYLRQAQMHLEYEETKEAIEEESEQD